MPERVDVAVVGGGIVGLATAYRLHQEDPAMRVVVLEAESQVGLHQSSHNSGVLHAGVYYTPGSAKALLCREGKAAMESFCEAHGVPVTKNGKLIVALDETELPRFDALVERATANGVPGMRVLGPAELRDIEPDAAGIRAIHSPSTGVVEFGAVCRALADSLPDVRLGQQVTGIVESGDVARVTTTSDEFEAGTVVVCAGLQAERVAAASGLRPSVRVVPFRGSWLALTAEGAELVRGNIYPVPDPMLPFLGVHFTRRYDGAVWAGPNAVLSLAYPGLVARAAVHPGLWRLAWTYKSVAVREVWEDRIRTAYIRQMQRYVPAVSKEHVVGGPKPFGVRAQALGRDGRLVDDFVIEGTRRVVHVLNAPSPAATSALAIGRHIATEVEARRRA